MSLKLKIEAIFMPYSPVGFALALVVENSGVPELGLESFPIKKAAKVPKRELNAIAGRREEKQRNSS